MYKDLYDNNEEHYLKVRSHRQQQQKSDKYFDSQKSDARARGYPQYETYQQKPIHEQFDDYQFRAQQQDTIKQLLFKIQHVDLQSTLTQFYPQIQNFKCDLSSQQLKNYIISNVHEEIKISTSPLTPIQERKTLSQRHRIMIIILNQHFETIEENIGKHNQHNKPAQSKQRKHTFKNVFNWRKKQSKKFQQNSKRHDQNMMTQKDFDDFQSYDRRQQRNKESKKTSYYAKQITKGLISIGGELLKTYQNSNFLQQQQQEKWSPQFIKKTGKTVIKSTVERLLSQKAHINSNTVNRMVASISGSQHLKQKAKNYVKK